MNRAWLLILVTIAMPIAGWMVGRSASSPEPSLAPEQRVAKQSLSHDVPRTPTIKQQLRNLVSHSLPSEEALQQRETLFAQLATDDPEGFLSLFEEGLAGMDQKELLIQCVESLAAKDPQRAARAIKKLPGGWQQAEAWTAFAQAGAIEHGPEALAEADQAGRFRWHAMKALITRWSDDDPGGALQALTANNGIADVETWFRLADTDIMAKWVRQDASAAFDWLGQLPVSDAFRKNIEFFLGHSLRGNLSDIEAMPNESRERVLEIIGPDEYAWLGRRHEALALVEHDPKSALESALGTLDTRIHEGRKLVKSVLEKVKAADPQQAIDLAMTLPGRAMRHEFFKEYSRSESAQDPHTLFKWAKDLEDPAARAGAIEGTIQSWINDDFVSAVQALTSVAGETLSFESYRRITGAISAETLIGNEANQKAVRDLLEAMPTNKQQRWLREIKENMGGTLPTALRPFDGAF